jgi:hypothetical protein
MNKDRIVEKGMQNFLKLLTEAEDQSELDFAQEQPQQRELPMDTSLETQPELKPQAVDAGTNIKFLSTLTMFTTKNPPDSNTWIHENNPQYIPLKDGRIVKTISKLFPELRVKSANAARYGDNQFRILLHGQLRAPTKIKIKGFTRERAEEGLQREQREQRLRGSTETYLDYIRVENKAGLPLQGKEELLTTLKENKKIKLKGIDLTDLMVWTQIMPPEEAQVKKVIKPEEEEPEEKKVSGKQEKKPEEERPIENPEDNPNYEAIVKQIMDDYDKKSKEARRMAKEAMIDWSKKNNGKNITARDIEAIVRDAKLESISYGKSSDEFGRYFRMLLEAQNSTELESGKGGEILSHLNDRIFETWFSGKGGIAAPTTNRVFIGNVFEWFAAESAIFKPEKRTVDKVREKSSIDITLDGALIMEVEVWIDARLMGTNITDEWTFQMLSNGGGKVIAKQSYKTPGSLMRTGKEAKPDLQQQAAVNPQR